ncbi:hypothetical protein A0H81_13022 [Grifola frondosa]|uniref:Uncharacterized protein n=1 Tax=Grifola frondosa TaxID=5627 RepID=A0A1C7LSR7_GRIFR|nr:hypothetical protein A0H81_13022 [Grifola frondosa]
MSSDFVNPIEVTFIPIDKGEDQHSSKSFIQDVETPLPPKGARTPLDIDIRSISSHAQAEALVQRAQQSILDMQHNGVTVASAKNSLGSDRTPLSAKLAAYGESLAIERKFKEEEERMKSPSSATSHLAEDLAALRGYPHVHLSHSPRDLDRKFSLEERRPEARSRMKTKVKRPHTSGGISVSADASQSILRSVSPTRSHKQSISGGILADAIPTSIDPDKFNTALGASITPPRTLRLTEEPASIALPPPRIVRSRTPDPVSDMLNVPSLNGGSPLSRVSTAPLQDIMSERGMSEQERQVARANKLAKMGLSSYDSWPHAPYGHVRGSSSKHLFGGIKTFVQTLTGKS